MPIVLSIVCFILEVTGLGNGEGALLIIIIGISLLNWILLSLKRLWFERRSQKIARQLDDKIVTVVR